MTNNCNKFYMVVSGDGCSGVATSNGISLANFISWNPDLKSDCSGLFPGYYVCVGIIGMTTSTTFVTSSSTSTTSGNGITTPTPTQVGMVSNCDLFYDVQSGDGCFQIAQNYGINLNDFYAWNPAVGSSCQQLFPDYYVCVGTVGSNPPSSSTSMSSTSTHSATSTTSGSRITTPTPTQAGMVSNCDLFYDVKSGDGCYDIAQSYGISLNDFYAWNPAVGNDCSGLWPDYYVCVGIGGSSPPPSSTTSTHSSTTSSGSGVTTPTPTQAGMVNNCDAFYDVQSGDGCWAIANEYSISLDNFYAWNPAVGNDCSGLWPDYYVCVGTT
jgi:LysM repeat protein